MVLLLSHKYQDSLLVKPHLSNIWRSPARKVSMFCRLTSLLEKILRSNGKTLFIPSAMQIKCAIFPSFPWNLTKTSLI